VEQYYMVNGAVAIEAYNPLQLDVSGMVQCPWQDYDDRLWSTEWHELFSAEDQRSELTWRGRFASAADEAFAFYSPGDEVLEAYSGCVLPLTGGSSYAWVKQEKLKGTTLPLLGGSLYGGWGFNPYWYVPHPTGDPEYPFILEPPYPSETESIPNSELPEHPFFQPGSEDELFDPSTGSAHAAENEARLLAEMIPALSRAAGFDAIAIEQLPDFDMQLAFETDQAEWPHPFNEWLHGDVKNVAYVHLWRLFDEVVGLIGDFEP
jgi:hypothetical protein